MAEKENTMMIACISLATALCKIYLIFVGNQGDGQRYDIFNLFLSATR